MDETPANKVTYTLEYRADQKDVVGLALSITSFFIAWCALPASILTLELLSPSYPLSWPSQAWSAQHAIAQAIPFIIPNTGIILGVLGAIRMRPKNWMGIAGTLGCFADLFFYCWAIAEIHFSGIF